MFTDKQIDFSNANENTKAILKHSKKWLKKEIYYYVMHGMEKHYSEFFLYLMGETDARSSLEHYFIDAFVYTFPHQIDEIFDKLLYLANHSYTYDCLYEGYFDETIAKLLDIPELVSYHNDIKTLRDNLTALKLENCDLYKSKDGIYNLLAINQALVKNTDIELP